MARLDGKVALVTGAGQGIGRGIALALAGEGARLGLMGRTASKLEHVRDEIREAGGHATAVVGDVADGVQATTVVDTVVADLGGLDILVNNAQEYAFGTIADLDIDQLEHGWASGAMGTLHFMRAARSHLGGHGVIINISSGAATDPAPHGVGGYAAVKAAIDTLSRAAAVEWAADGIRVMTLIPFARTPAVAAVLDGAPEMEESILSTVPLGRFGDPQAEVGRAAAFLASDDASFITGSALVVDGGSTYLR